MDRIVVGVDGSDGSAQALAWAVDEARRWGDATVEVVHAWEPPVLTGSPVGEVPPVVIDGSFDDAAHLLIADALAHVDTTGLTVQQVVVEGPPGATLCAHAADAALLVVAASGHGKVLEALIGSVSNYCVHHARCPVVVMPRNK